MAVRLRLRATLHGSTSQAEGHTAWQYVSGGVCVSHTAWQYVSGGVCVSHTAWQYVSG